MAEDDDDGTNAPKWQNERAPQTSFIKVVGVIWCTIIAIIAVIHYTHPPPQSDLLTLLQNSTVEDSIVNDISGEEEDEDDSTGEDGIDSSLSTNKNKAVISSKYGRIDGSWIGELLPDWDNYIYDTDRIHKNKNATLNSKVGREGAVYLTYIVDHYHDLPDYMVFVHGPRYQWHNDDPMFDSVPMIANLSLENIDEQGYVSLRCATTPGCGQGGGFYPVPGHKDGFFESQGLYAKIHKHFFPYRPVPKKVDSPCCAQFAVSREAVQRNSLRKYRQFRKWIWAMDGGNMPYKIGLTMEYFWHILFGMPPILCQDLQECYCKKWGVCGLECRKYQCKGRWWRNPFRVFPQNWPKEQGKNGWPIAGWWNYLDKNWNYHPPRPRPAKPPMPHKANPPSGAHQESGG